MNNEQAITETVLESKATEEPIIKIEGLEKSFGQNDILKGVDLEVRKGENLVVLGKSGSGKSVTIKCIIGLIYPDAGEITVLGKKLSDLNYKEMNELRLRMGFLFQGGALYDSMTVRENLGFPLRKSPTKIPRSDKTNMIENALHEVGLSEAIDKKPSELSGGMQKRIGLARSLILHPEIMLYDEPTTGLDTVTAREISELILAMQKKHKTSSIIITHDMACAKITADRMVVLKEGVIIASGTYEELENSDDGYVRSFFN